MKIALYTLGCKVNQYESEVIKEAFLQEGYTLAQNGESADICIVNSCTVTRASDRKTALALRRFRQQNPDAVLILTGCFPQAFPEEARVLFEADIITGTANKGALPALAAAFFAHHQPIVQIAPHTSAEEFEPMRVNDMAGHTRAFVKIQDGCDRFCAYCIIPFARGRVRSKPLEELKAELRTLAQNGYTETVLVGINLSLYGREYGLCLLDAARAACDTVGIERVRLGSLEPDTLTDEIIDAMAGMPKLCDHFHLSLQSGCDQTLARMRRRYTCADYAKAVKRLRERFPNCAITTDIMVGFPGETEEEFARSLAFAREIGFAKAHVFSYSRRGGTVAANLPGQLPRCVREERANRMKAACADSRRAFLLSQVGSTAHVLFERNIYADGQEGHTTNYTPVRVKYSANSQLCAGNSLHTAIKYVKIVSAKQDYCIGELV